MDYMPFDVSRREKAVLGIQQRWLPELECGKLWWTWTGSNRRPLPCHGGLDNVKTPILLTSR